jgi:putative oxygen-independent coproporphyrinogen III oxidase
MDRLMPGYQAALERELEQARAALPFGPLSTVYFGGGTPSLLPADIAGRMLAHVASVFEVEPGAEVTLEANPASTDPEKLATWRAGGVNRLSLGVQGFDARALAVLERRADGAQAERAYRQARAAGFDEVSLDLIYGVPFQVPEAWAETVVRAVALGPEHLSCYCLTFEAGTLLTRRHERGLLPQVDADAQWAQLHAADRLLGRAGYERYEVSSWARPGHRARHNQAYWDCRPVYGAGAGAHSYATDGERAWRWWNIARPRDYIAAAAAGRVELDREELAPERARAERVMLGLRTTAGLEPPPGFEAPLAALEGAGLVARAGDRYAPTGRGLDLHNRIALEVL